MRKYPKIKYPRQVDELRTQTDTLVVQEKLDGANGRFTLTDEGELLFGSRNVEFRGECGTPLPRDELNGSFKHAHKYIETFATLDESHSHLTFFGECMHKHRIDYDAWEGQHPNPVEKHPPNFILFDVWDSDIQQWFTQVGVDKLADEIGLGNARPQTWEIDVDADFEIPQSDYRTPDETADNEFDKKGLAEGIVVKNPSTGNKTKVVHQSFKEVNQNSDTNKECKFIQMYVTEARIEKHAYKLVDSGEYDSLNMEMMEVLPQKVLEDVFAEHGWDILQNDNKIVLDEESKSIIRKRTPKKCASVLKGMLMK